MTSIDSMVRSETYKRRKVLEILNRHFAEPLKTALIRATTKTKALAGAHLGRPLVSSFCRHFFDGNNIHLVDFHNTRHISLTCDLSETECLQLWIFRSFDFIAVLTRQTSVTVAYKPGLENLLECFV